MKDRALVIPLLFTLVCVVPSCRTNGVDEARETEASTDGDVAAITASVGDWTRLYNAGDFDRIVSTFYSERAVQMPPDQALRRGREAILLGYRRNRELNDERCDRSVVEDVRVSGDLAVVRGTDTGTSAPRDGGEPTPYRVKWLVVLERQSDGTWKWICEMWNDDPQAYNGAGVAHEVQGRLEEERRGIQRFCPRPAWLLVTG